MILVIQTAFLGDLLLTIPLLKQLRLKYPNKKIHIVARKGFGSLLKDLGFVDDYYESDSDDKIGFFKAKEKFSGLKFDVLFCVHKSLRSHLLSLAVKSSLKIGYANWWNILFFSKRVTRRMEQPEVIRQLDLLGAISSDIKSKISSTTQIAPYIKIPQWSSMALTSHMMTKSDVYSKFQLPNKKLVLLSPGSVWATKKWSLDGFEKLAQALSDEYQVILCGSKSESELCERVRAKNSGIINLAGKTSLIEFLMLNQHASLSVTNDSGAMHMASVAGIPCISIFGPTVQEMGYQPWNPKALVIENNELGCRPCSSHGTKKCPLQTHECMSSITTNKVMDKAVAILHSL